ncbi:hypothetical protein PA7_09590 [Pseudonocardia asaccharolytica DSM 44247 = NBRC 16224]|uniref:DUF5709 domain-containing protein n=1 Tax=Pseudonocardia asaccharolytica DSM 44247 = NBRC 16224 TaxID=1123024 RepID=A0A511CX46_9PSEU|nr:DUF5709 domain-containing protein [Pseudonocardia asaccharolytica]GEL17122.1 hypothetical protein PA7_09590 [Pseudonocardia asaccharolytica DSM 44247 = NBRC 16224]
MDDNDAADVGIDGGTASAEEAAVHDVDGDISIIPEDSRVDDPEIAAALDDGPRVEQAWRDAARDAGADAGPKGTV